MNDFIVQLMCELIQHRIHLQNTAANLRHEGVHLVTSGVNLIV